MAYDTAAGVTFEVTTEAPATYDETGFAALTYTLVGEVTEVGEVLGKTYEMVEHLPLASRGVKKSKGSYNNGSIAPTVAFDEDDAGQAILLAAVDSDDPISFLITLDSGYQIYGTGLVMGMPVSIGDANTTNTGTPTIEITDLGFVTVAA